MTAVNQTKREMTDIFRLLSILIVLKFKKSKMSLFALLEILELNQWKKVEDDHITIAMVHPDRIPRVIRITKEEPIPIGTVKAILKSAGIIN